MAALPDRLEDLARRLTSLEENLAAGERPSLDGLDEEPLRAVYAKRSGNSRRALPFRTPTVVTLLERMRRLLGPPRVIGVARSRREIVAREDGKTRTGLVIETGPRDQAVRWRLDAIHDVRFWGIEIRPSDEDHREQVERSVWTSAVARLASDLSGVGTIEERFADRADGLPATLLAGEEGEAFERLLIDVLNEGSLRARLSPLEEDFLEKTDARVHVPGLERRKGARIQIAMTADPTRMREKREKIRAAEELVLLSPWTMAEALTRTPQRRFSRDLVGEVLEVLGTKGAPPDVTARGIKSILVGALRDPGDDLRGPITRVPAPLRRFVQELVTREALESTAALRANTRERRGITELPSKRRR
jgi:hypothetical protein